MSAALSTAFREITAERAEEFVAHGYKRRHFFPHRIYHLPKCGPDGLTLAARMCGIDDPAAMYELVLYADESTLTEFPPDLFFDDDVVWHQQQFGRPGQVGTANLVLDGPTAYSMNHLSDLVQRITRRRECKTRIDARFKGWSHMLLNAVLSFAQERGARHVRTATAALTMAHADPTRRIGPEIFERIYDRTVTSLFSPERDGDWWTIELADVRDRIVSPVRRTEERPRRKTICVCHDVERGMGHTDVDPEFAKRADEDSPRHLKEMAEIEADLEVRATYCVVGSMLSEVRDRLEAGGHCLAFHSFDHRLDADRQLARCRGVDYRLKGYRPPRSQLTPELSLRNLLSHNFEWLASSAASLGLDAPAMRTRLVDIPIAFDDFPMHEAGMPYEDWEREALRRIARSDFAALSLHDCYASHWLPNYSRFLERVREMGELRTLDQVAADVTLSSAD
jgi:hypothetical protein